MAAVEILRQHFPDLKIRVINVVDLMTLQPQSEEGTTTTPFDMAVLNDIDRFHLAKDVIDRVPSLGSEGAYLSDKFIRHYSAPGGR